MDVTWKKAVPDAAKPADYDALPSRYSVEAGNYYTLYASRYLVSGSAVKTPRKIFWTEDAFRSTGKPVAVPPGRVGVVNVVNNDDFPKRVETAYRPLGQTPVVEYPGQQLEESGRSGTTRSCGKSWPTTAKAASLSSCWETPIRTAGPDIRWASRSWTSSASPSPPMSPPTWANG